VPKCGKQFGTRTHLTRHINDKHERPKFYCTEFTCAYSVGGGRWLERKDNLARHMKNIHGIEYTRDTSLEHEKGEERYPTGDEDGISLTNASVVEARESAKATGDHDDEEMDEGDAKDTFHV
jgi:predicted small metal-binding protein